jgi:hypothetical protein
MRLFGLLGFGIPALVLLPIMQQKEIELHGLKPGMLTREVILQAHAPLDTMIWGGAEGVSILHFHGAIEKDTGEFRITVKGPKIEQILFVSPTRDTAKTRIAYDKMHATLTKLYGDAEQYHNTYHIWTWEKPGQQMKLSTMDKGLFYSITLVEHGSKLVPSPDNEVPPK